MGRTKFIKPLPEVIPAVADSPVTVQHIVSRASIRKRLRRRAGGFVGNRKGLPAAYCTRCKRMFFPVDQTICEICRRRERLGDSLGIIVRCTSRGIDRRAEFGLPEGPIPPIEVLYRRT